MRDITMQNQPTLNNRNASGASSSNATSLGDKKAADALSEGFAPVLESFLQTPTMVRVQNGDISLDEYKCLLREIYYYTRENPQLQALASVYFRGRQRELVKPFLDHASSEVGHDQLALNDIETLGGTAGDAPYRNPLPATTALTSFAFYQIYNLNPLGYLGYLYFLEFLPTQAGDGLATGLMKGGVTENAMSFIRDHIEIDQAHNRLMMRYADVLIVDQAALDSVVYAMEMTAYLYDRFVSDAFASAAAPVDTGWNWEELRADGLTPADLTNAASAVA